MKGATRFFCLVSLEEGLCLLMKFHFESELSIKFCG